MIAEEKTGLGEKEILDILLESSRATRRLNEEYDALKFQYPNQWVAISKDGLVAHHAELAGVIDGFTAAGYKNTQLAVRFLNTKPRVVAL